MVEFLNTWLGLAWLPQGALERRRLLNDIPLVCMEQLQSVTGVRDRVVGLHLQRILRESPQLLAVETTLSYHRANIEHRSETYSVADYFAACFRIKVSHKSN